MPYRLGTTIKACFKHFSPAEMFLIPLKNISKQSVVNDVLSCSRTKNIPNAISPADWCKNCWFWFKGTKVGTMVACYILNEIRYGPLHDSTSSAFHGDFTFLAFMLSYKKNKFKIFCSEFQK